MAEQHLYPRLNLPSVTLRARRNAGRIEVWDALRGCWLVLTPEEWVRQHVLSLLIARCRVPAGRIVCEYPVPLNGQPQRADIVAVDRYGAPQIVVECKAADVAIDQSVLDQAVRYNSVLHARFVVLTNGLTLRCLRRADNGEYSLCELADIETEEPD